MRINGMTTLGDAYLEAHSLYENCYDETLPVRDLSFDSLDRINIRGESWPLRENAQRQLSTRLGIPFTYLKKCPNHVQALNLNHWLMKERNDDLLFRFDDDIIRAVFTPRYVPVWNVQLIEELYSLGYDEYTRAQIRLDAEYMSISIPDSDSTFDINGLGDKVMPGLSIANSEVGLAGVSVSAYMLRLVCSNGMIGRTSASLSRRHISASLLEGLPGMIAEANRELYTLRDKFRISLDTSVTSADSTFERLNRQFALSDFEKEAVAWGYEQERGDPCTMFHIVNGYTKGAQHPDLNAHSANRLERVGGNVLAMLRPGQRELLEAA